MCIYVRIMENQIHSINFFWVKRGKIWLASFHSLLSINGSLKKYIFGLLGEAEPFSFLCENMRMSFKLHVLNPFFKGFAFNFFVCCLISLLSINSLSFGSEARTTFARQSKNKRVLSEGLESERRNESAEITPVKDFFGFFNLRGKF